MLGGLLGGCSVNPATGGLQVPVLVGPEGEVELGDDAHRGVLRQHHGLYQHPALQTKLREIVARLAPHVRRSDGVTLAWRVFLLNDPAPNAMAAPGGRAYVTRGLVALVNDEAELASIVAHEMGHAAARHGAVYPTGVILEQMLRVAAVLAGVDERAALETFQLIAAAYSRQQESEADALGFAYLTAAGYDPAAAARAMRNLHRLRQYQELVGDAEWGGQYSLFNTHPLDQSRIDDLAARAAALGKAGERRDEDGRAAYLALLDGMDWGAAVASGLIAGRRFAHPGLGVGFTVPPGYRLALAEKRVVAENPQTGGLIIFDAAPSPDAENASAYLKNLWEATAKLSKVRRFRAAGFSGAMGETRLATAYGEASVVAAVLLDRANGRALRFVCLSAGMNADAGPTFRAMLKGAESVAADDFRRRAAERIEILRAALGERIELLAARLGRTPHAAQFLRMLNGLSEEQEPPPGMALKTIVAD